MLTGLFNKCPSCHNGLIFKSIFRLNEKCQFCNFKFGLERIGDLIAWIASFLLSIAIVPLVLVLEFKFSLSFFEKFLIICPFVLIITILFIRFLRFFFLKREYLQIKKNEKF